MAFQLLHSDHYNMLTCPKTFEGSCSETLSMDWCCHQSKGPSSHLTQTPPHWPTRLSSEMNRAPGPDTHLEAAQALHPGHCSTASLRCNEEEDSPLKALLPCVFSKCLWWLWPGDKSHLGQDRSASALCQTSTPSSVKREVNIDKL